MTMTEALSHVREGFSPKLIKQAIGIASDKRYAGGNMSGAVDAIEKLQKGLSDHPQVMAVLKRQNEAVELDEGRMKELHHHIKMGKSAKEIAKIMKLDFKTINALVDGLTYEERKERYERVMSPYRSEGTESLDEDVTMSFPWQNTDKSLNILMKVLKPGSALNKTINLTVKVDSEMKKMSALLSKVNDLWEQVERKLSEGQKNESVEEGTESLDEKYDLYHKTFSGAMQHSYEYAKKKFKIEIDPTEIDDKVAMGPPKPKNGKTNSYRLKGTNGKGIQVQVYNTGTSFELNMYKESVDDVNESVEIDEASKEGTIRIIDLGNRNQDKIRKDLGVDKLGDSGFQVQVMTKGKFVNVGKPYKTMKDAEKVRKSGQHSLPLEMFNNKGAKHAKNEDIDQNRDDKKTTRIAQLNLQIAKAKQTINKLNDKET